MNKSNTILLIIAVLLILIGSIIFVGALFGSGWDFSNLSQEEYETNTTVIGEKFNSISIDTDTAGIVFAPSIDGACKAECYERDNAKHSVSVHNGVLVIELIDEREWYDNIGINYDSPKITLYLPKTEYTSVTVKCTTGDIEIPSNFRFDDALISVTTGDVSFDASVSGSIKIHGTTGSVRLQDISAGKLDVSVSTGMVTLTDVNCSENIGIKVTTGKAAMTNVACQSFFSEGNTGSITMKNVIASNKISIERSTGDVRFDKCDAAEISVDTDTGDVRGSLLSDKIFFVETDTGKVRVPRSDTGGRCEIETDTGDVIIEITN